MKIHEYQAKVMLRDHGVPVPAGSPASSAVQARQAAEALGGERWVVKAQIHAGGRFMPAGVARAAASGGLPVFRRWSTAPDNSWGAAW